VELPVFQQLARAAEQHLLDHDAPAPEANQVLVSTLSRVSIPLAARVMFALARLGDKYSSTPAPRVTVMAVELLTNVTTLPTGKATDELGGIVRLPPER